MRSSHVTRRWCPESVAGQWHQRDENRTRIGHQIHVLRAVEAVYSGRFDPRPRHVRTVRRWIDCRMHVTNVDLSPGSQLLSFFFFFHLVIPNFPISFNCFSSSFLVDIHLHLLKLIQFNFFSQYLMTSAHLKSNAVSVFETN